jgi:tripeptide aminopeptidase
MNSKSPIKHPVDTARLAETFQTLVSIDSVSRHEGRICRAILSMMPPIIEKTFIDGAGDPTGSDTGNLILKIKGNRDAAPMMLNAHMDTVEPGIGVKPRYTDGVFTSSGDTVLGADDKSAIAIILEALRVIHEKNLPHGPIDVVFTICEEIGLLGAKHLDFGLIDATFGYALDTYDTKGIVTRAPAANRFEIRVHGRSAHAGADPEKGISAVWVASKAVAGLRLGRIDDETTCNIGEMQAGGATNIVPHLVRLRGEARSHDQDKLAVVTRRIIDAFEDTAAEYRRIHHEDDIPRIEVDLEKDFPLNRIPENHPVVTMATKAAANLGRDLTLKTSGGGSDANIFFSKGIMTGVLGTGMKDVHTVRESIRLDDMVDAATLLLEIIAVHADGGSP